MKLSQIFRIAEISGLKRVVQCCDGVPDKVCMNDVWKGNIGVFVDNIVTLSHPDKLSDAAFIHTHAERLARLMGIPPYPETINREEEIRHVLANGREALQSALAGSETAINVDALFNAADADIEARAAKPHEIVGDGTANCALCGSDDPNDPLHKPE